MRKEIFAPINGYEGYSIGSLGSVKNKHGKFLKASRDKHGYLTVSLCKNGYARQFFVHRLVALAFIGNPENKPTVNHINGDKTDNRVDNLEWATQSENNFHAYKMRLAVPHKNRGEKNGRTKLSNRQVCEIRLMLQTGYKNIELAAMYQVSASVISRIKKHKTF